MSELRELEMAFRQRLPSDHHWSASSESLCSPPAHVWRVGIDVAWADGQPTGTGIYTQELVRALLQRDTHTTYVLYFRDPRRSRNSLWRLEAPNLEKRIVSSPITNIRNQILAYHLYRDRIDLFHSTGFFLPYGWLGRKVVTIHDVNYLRYGRYWRRQGTRTRWLGLFLQAPLSARVSDSILTPSQFSARDIVRYLRVSPRKVHVVPHGVRASLRATQPPEKDMLKRLNLAHYLLYVGVLSPHKNLERLIQAFSTLPPCADGPLKLVLIGRDDASYGERILRPLVSALGLQERVIFTGYVSEDVLGELYAASLCVVQISEAEGFGLPIVEAMASGIPVVAANATATAEIAGNAALLVNPTDVTAIADGLARAIGDEPLRNILRKSGLRRAGEFTWARTAEQTWAIYQSALQSKGR
jgi:glycosyltransferase involved in cell wall biosynthesis